MEATAQYYLDGDIVTDQLSLLVSAIQCKVKNTLRHSCCLSQEELWTHGVIWFSQKMNAYPHVLILTFLML